MNTVLFICCLGLKMEYLYTFVLGFYYGVFFYYVSSYFFFVAGNSRVYISYVSISS